MTSMADPSVVLRHAAVQAAHAPSIYNTQPWYLRLTPTELRLHADPDRWLMSVDRLARQLLISCGCALFNARASVAADGWTPKVVRNTTDMASSSLIAAVGLTADDIGAADAARAELNCYIKTLPNDQTLWAPLFDPGQLIDRLLPAASAEGIGIVPVTRPTYRRPAADGANALIRRDRADRRKHWAWAQMSGSSDWSNPPVEAAGSQFAAVLCTRSDTPEDWVASGEGLQRILLELTRLGCAADISIAAIEVPEARAQLRSGLGGVVPFPQVLLHIGRASTPISVPQRRLLVDVIHEAIEG